MLVIWAWAKNHSRKLWLCARSDACKMCTRMVKPQTWKIIRFGSTIKASIPLNMRIKWPFNGSIAYFVGECARVCVCARVMVEQNASKFQFTSFEFIGGILPQCTSAHGSQLHGLHHWSNPLPKSNIWFLLDERTTRTHKKIANICWTRIHIVPHTAVLAFRERAADVNIYFPSNEVECAFIARRALNQSHRNFHHDIASAYIRHTICKR